MTRKETYRCEYVCCGKCKSKCAHGPYWYAYWSEDGKTKKRYVGKKDPTLTGKEVPTIKPQQVDGYNRQFEPILSEKTATVSLAWKILGDPMPLDHEHARDAYRKLSKLHHPDRGGTTRGMQYVQAAWSHLRAWMRW